MNRTRPGPSRATLRAALLLALLLAGGHSSAQDVGPVTSRASPPPTAPAAATPPVAAPPVATPQAVTPPAAAPSVDASETPPTSAAPGGASTGAPSQEGAPPTVGLGTAPAPVPAVVTSATLPHDLSPWGMFMAADWVVKSVMIGLAFASLVTWTIWLAKAFELALARSKAKRFFRRLEDAASLADVAASARGATWATRGPVAALVAAAEGEIARSGDMAIDGVKERTQVALQRIEARAGRSMARGTGLLATIGSTAPFVGLFGTVWGIMNAFIGISQANTTNLAVVAPGIAEALLATAIGLVAAIPAVIIYNAFARSIAGYRAILADASAEVLRHLSRDLDRRRHAMIDAGAHLRAAEWT